MDIFLPFFRAKNIPFLIISLFVINCFSACVPPKIEEVVTDVSIDIQDSVFQKIANWQDLKKVDQLYSMLYHPNPSYRFQATRALGSMGDLVNIDTLARLFNDPVDEVRAMAAFALGQSNKSEALDMLTKAFMKADTAKQFLQSQKAILEAVGQCGDLEMLQLLSSGKNYSPTQDTALLEGQAKGIFRFGLRGMTNPQSIQRMQNILIDNDYPTSVQLIAATYLARIPAKIDSTMAVPLSAAFENHPSSDVRMALALALGKTKQEEALTSLIGQFQKETDYRVKCNILRALKNFPYENVRPLAIEAIRSPNEHISRTAVQYLLEKSTPPDATLWWRFAKDSLPTPIQLELYRVANRHLPAFRVEYRNAINAELRQLYTQKKSAYEKATALKALAEFPWNFRYIFREGQLSENQTIKTASIEALKEIGERADFKQFFGLSTRRVTQELARNFTTAIRSKSPGAVATAAIAMRSEKRDYRPYIDSIFVYQNILDSLALPAMIESYNELAKTIAYFKGNDDFKAQKPDFNHPIDWKTLEGLAHRPQVEMTINGGEVLLELWPDIAPGTVVNFIKLTKNGFLKNKNFHRIVPNFVIQGGSPSGDSYGSLDYTIRSELSPISYDQQGLLAMASAGADTEGTQFFITHSPTLHLDGGYTLFGKVVSGMDVVHDIQMGDRITSCKLKE